MTVILVKCGWCGCDMGEKDGQGQSGVSHGICPECSKQVQEEHEISMNLKSYWQNLNAHSQGV